MTDHLDGLGGVQGGAFRPSSTWWLLGPAAVCLLSLGIEALSWGGFRIPNPPAILLLVVAFASFKLGLLAGLTAAGVAWVYFAWSFSLPGLPFRYEAEDLVRLLIWAGCTPAIALMIGILRDKQDTSAARSLSRSSGLFHAFMDRNPAVAWLKDHQGRYLYVNHSFERVFARDRSEVEGRTDEDVWPAEVARRLRENDEAIRAGGRPRQMEEQVPTADGKMRVWTVVKFPHVDPGGRTCVGGVAIDITDRRSLSEQLQHAQKMESLGRLSGGVAHDFNNLLTVITGYAEILLESLPEEGDDWKSVREIADAAERSQSLTRQLLAFSRRQPIGLRTLDLYEAVSGTSRMLDRILGADIRLEIRKSPDVPRIKADPGQLDQVVMNLAVNARDAMPEGGTFSLEIGRETVEADSTTQTPEVEPGEYAVLTVTDTGCGMDAETRARVFEPFFTTKEQGKGTGLGLSTVYGIIRQIGGHIRLVSEKGEGTTFRILLPEASSQTARRVRPEPEAAPAANVRGRETILLVEDESTIRLMARVALISKGYNVLEARNGEEAVRLVGTQTTGIDLLLTDSVLPGMNGLETALKISEKNPGLKVLLTSGYSESELLERVGEAAESMAFIQKPFGIRDLVSRVRQVLDSRASYVPENA